MPPPSRARVFAEVTSLAKRENLATLSIRDVLSKISGALGCTTEEVKAFKADIRAKVVEIVTSGPEDATDDASTAPSSGGQKPKGSSGANTKTVGKGKGKGKGKGQGQGKGKETGKGKSEGAGKGKGTGKGKVAPPSKGKGEDDNDSDGSLDETDSDVEEGAPSSGGPGPVMYQPRDIGEGVVPSSSSSSSSSRGTATKRANPSAKKAPAAKKSKKKAAPVPAPKPSFEYVDPSEAATTYWEVYPGARRKTAVAAEKAMNKAAGGWGKKKTPAAPAGDGAAAATKPKKPPKKVLLSPALQHFLGAEENLMTRADVQRQITAYVKEKKLQDPKDGRVILCDDDMQEVFKCKKTTYFKISALLSRHLKDPNLVCD